MRPGCHVTPQPTDTRITAVTPGSLVYNRKEGCTSRVTRMNGRFLSVRCRVRKKRNLFPSVPPLPTESSGPLSNDRRGDCVCACVCVPGRRGGGKETCRDSDRADVCGTGGPFVGFLCTVAVLYLLVPALCAGERVLLRACGGGGGGRFYAMPMYVHFVLY